MARVYRNPADQVMHHIALSEGVKTLDAEDVWGGVHRLVGRLTHEDLSGRYAGFLSTAGLAVEAFPDGEYWIVNEDCDGLVAAVSFADAKSYQEELDHYTATRFEGKDA